MRFPTSLSVALTVLCLMFASACTTVPRRTASPFTLDRAAAMNMPFSVSGQIRLHTSNQRTWQVSACNGPYTNWNRSCSYGQLRDGETATIQVDAVEIDVQAMPCRDGSPDLPTDDTTFEVVQADGSVRTFRYRTTLESCPGSHIFEAE